MPRRIIGQCHKADFKELFHLVGLMERGEEVDFTNLTKKEKVAVMVLSHFIDKGIPFKLLDKIEWALLWDMGNGKAAFQFQLLDPRDLDTLLLLRRHR